MFRYLPQVVHVAMHTTHQITAHLRGVLGRRCGKEVTVEDVLSLLPGNSQTVLLLLGAATTQQTREHERLRSSQYR